MKAYFSWLAKLLTLVGVFVVVVPILFFGVIAALIEAGKDGGGAGAHQEVVSVVELKGMILSSREVIDTLHKEVARDVVRGIVLRIDSPGGAVGPSQEIYEAVKELRQKKPIIASMGSVAASGGLYSSLAATRVFAQSSTMTGSIGVIMQFPNFKKIADKVGFSFVTVKSGQLKDVGNSFREMTPEDLDFLQGTVNAVQEDFINAIVESRKLQRQEVLKFADGCVILGKDAKSKGLVDNIGGVYDAARAVYQELGEPLKEGHYPKLHYPEDKLKAFKSILGNIAKLPESFLGGWPRGNMKLLYMMP